VASERHLAIQVPVVTHERLDDEVIAINLETGVYYALVGTAADVWSAFDPAGTVTDVATLLAGRYGAGLEVVQADVDAFARRLEAAGLLGEQETAVEPARPLPSLAPGSAWASPQLEEYRDMADLVLIDPIHQVDETGWPRLPEASE